MSGQRVALISGSSRGIGRGIALQLARENYTVFITGRDESAVQNTVRDIQNSRGIAHPLVADLTDEKQITHAVEQVMKTAGQLDLLVCNLGSGRTANVWNPTPKDVRQVFETNFFSAVTLTHSALEKMKPGSNVVFISSIAGCEALGAPIAYAAAKTALLSYAKSLSAQAAAKGIRINTVSPGNVLFDGSTWDDKIKKDADGVKSYIQAQVPLNGFAKPEDIAKAVSYLASAPFVTGHNLVVDGGQTRKMI